MHEPFPHGPASDIWRHLSHYICRFPKRTSMKEIPRFCQCCCFFAPVHSLRSFLVPTELVLAHAINIQVPSYSPLNFTSAYFSASIQATKKRTTWFRTVHANISTNDKEDRLDGRDANLEDRTRNYFVRCDKMKATSQVGHTLVH